jgi:hypothetical protein
MVPLSEYATVSQNGTLQDAVLALRKTHHENTSRKYLHRAIVVLDDAGAVVGKVSLLAMLRSLEPKYDEMLSDKRSLHVGFTAGFQKMMIEQLKLWDEPMDKICEKAAKLKVADFMIAPHEGEVIDADATLDKAIHQLVLGHHQSLLVVEGRTVVGILRLTDVFEVVADAICACEIGACSQ